MPIGLRHDRSWAALPATTTNDPLPFWKRRLRAQMWLLTPPVRVAARLAVA